MTNKSTEAALGGEFRTLFALGVVRDLTDGQLLEQYLTGEDVAAEAAFTVLVERHGPMVLNVCRAALDDPHDAQDAFQATFLVLLRRAGSIRKRDSVASWLFGVAMRLARRARHAAAVRRFHERNGGRIAAARADAAHGQSECLAGQSECLAVLREEIARLPERYREPVVLCYFEGLSTAAAARRLGCPGGTILSRLARGRDRLRRRLIQRGLAVSAVLLAENLIRQGAAAAVTATLVHSTVQIAVPTAAGRAVLGEIIPTSVAALARATLRSLLMTRLTIAAALLATAAAITTLAVPLVRSARGAGHPAAFQDDGSQQPESKNDRKAILRQRHELDLLQGTWYRISSEINRHKVFVAGNDPVRRKPMIVFKGDGWYGVSRDGKTLVKNHVVKLDPTRRPKAIDLYYLDSDGNPTDSVPIPGIYKVEGDILTLCLNIGGGPQDRPKEFATRAGPREPILDVYQRGRTAEEKPGPDDSNKHTEPHQQGAAHPALPRQVGSIPNAGNDGARALAYSPDGKMLASAGFDGIVRLWDVLNSREIGGLKGEKSTMRCVVYSPDGKTLANVNDAGLVQFWDVTTGMLKRTMLGLSESMRQAARGSVMVDAITFAPSGQLLAVSGFGPTNAVLADRSYELRVLDLRTGQARWSHMGRGDVAFSPVFSPNGKTLASGGYRSVTLWGAENGEPVRTLYPTNGAIRALAFTPDGQILIGGGHPRLHFGPIRAQTAPDRPSANHSDGVVTFWEVATGRVLDVLDGPPGGAWAVAVAPDGKTVASGGESAWPGREQPSPGQVRLWDIASRRLLWTAELGFGVVRGLAFAPDGETLAYCDPSGIGLIDVRTGKIERSLTKTNLTPQR